MKNKNDYKQIAADLLVLGYCVKLNMNEGKTEIYGLEEVKLTPRAKLVLSADSGGVYLFWREQRIFRCKVEEMSADNIVNILEFFSDKMKKAA